MSLWILVASLALADGPTCEQGRVLLDGERCCWPGQSWVEAEDRCGGAPKSCPDGLESFDIGCFNLQPNEGAPPHRPGDLLCGVVVPEIEGPRKRPEVVDAIGALTGPLRLCYQREVVADPSVRGTISAVISFKGSGKLSRLELAESTLRSPPVEACVEETLQMLQLAPAEAPSQVRVRLLFATASSE